MTENAMTETAECDADVSTPDRPGPARATGENYDDDPPGRQAGRRPGQRRHLGCGLAGT